MLLKRQKDLIAYLEKQNGEVSGNELAKFFGVSDRTIRSDIQKINSFYNTEKIIGNRKGYYLNPQKCQNIRSTTLPQTSQERTIYILRKALFDGFVELYDISDELYVSNIVIEQDIKKLQETLEPLQLKILRKDNKYYLEGNEEDKRKLFRHLLEKETKDSFLNIDKLSTIFINFDLIRVQEIFDKLIEEYNFKFNGIAYQLVLIHIGIALERIYNGYYIYQTPQVNLKYLGKEANIAKKLFEEVGDLLGCKIPEQEVVAFALLLLGNKVSSKTYEINLVEIEKFCEKGIQHLNNEFQINLICDDELRIGLSLHLASMLERLSHKVGVRNVLLEEIKRNYPLTFEMAIKFSDLISKEFNLEISENEIGFIALHLGVGYERQNKSNKYNVLIVHPYENAFGNSMVSKIRHHFDDRLIIVDLLNYVEMEDLEKLNLDFIISTIDLNLNIPTVVISPSFNTYDLDRLNKHIKNLDQISVKEEIKKNLSNFFDSRFFFKDITLENSQKIIKFLCNQLEKGGIVDKGFLESVLIREEISPTSFEQFFAVPHPMEFSANETKVAIAILKRPIQWGNYSVKLVMLFAVKKEHRKYIKTLYAMISDVLLQKETFEQLIYCEDCNDFISVFFNV